MLLYINIVHITIQYASDSAAAAAAATHTQMRDGMAHRPNERIYGAPEPLSISPTHKTRVHKPPGGNKIKPGISLLFIELRNCISGVIYVRSGSYRIVIVLMWYNSLLRIFLYIRNTNTHTRLVTTQNARTSHITHLHAAYTDT